MDAMGLTLTLTVTQALLVAPLSMTTPAAARTVANLHK
jgi:hypothetical protein